MPTHTASFPIAFRRLGSEWNKDLPALLTWATRAGYEAFDLNQATVADVETVRGAGLRLGSVDLIEMGKLLMTDAGQRKDLVARNVAYVKELAGAGVKVFFTVLIPGGSGSETVGELCPGGGDVRADCAGGCGDWRRGSD
jgi:hypothetical protein